VNTNSGVYHCAGTREYGKTKQGKYYMSECAAIKDGNRPAYGLQLLQLQRISFQLPGN
jgi:hypothetical protein